MACSTPLCHATRSLLWLVQPPLAPFEACECSLLDGKPTREYMALPPDGSVLSGLCLGTMLRIHPLTRRRDVQHFPSSFHHVFLSLSCSFADLRQKKVFTQFFTRVVLPVALLVRVVAGRVCAHDRLGSRSVLLVALLVRVVTGRRMVALDSRSKPYMKAERKTSTYALPKAS